MINVIFPEGLNEIKIPALYQWDYGRSLSISGVNTTNNVLQVHFSNSKAMVAIVRVAYKNGAAWEVNIPNALLREKHDIKAHIYLNEDGSGTTKKTIVIPVISRAMPDDYPNNAQEENELARLINYCNSLGGQLNAYNAALMDHVENGCVRLVTVDEYNAMIAAGTVKSDVIYCFEAVDVIAQITAEVTESLQDEIKNGDFFPYDDCVQDVMDKLAEGIEDETITIPYADEAGNASAVGGVRVSCDEETKKLTTDNGTTLCQRKLLWTGSVNISGQGQNDYAASVGLPSLESGKTYELVFGNGHAHIKGTAHGSVGLYGVTAGEPFLGNSLTEKKVYQWFVQYLSGTRIDAVCIYKKVNISAGTCVETPFTGSNLSLTAIYEIIE